MTKRKEKIQKKEVKKIEKEEKELKKEEKESKKELKREEILIGLVSLLLVVLVLLYVFWSKESEKPVVVDDPNVLQYGNFSFIKKDDGFWYTDLTIDYFVEKKVFEVPFYYNPKEVEDIEMRRGLEHLFLDIPNIHITLDPDYNSKAVVAGTEISKILGKVWFRKVKAGTTKESGNPGFPVITCQDITEDTRIIELRLGDETKIFQEEGCIIVQGTDEEELIRAADRLSYRTLKIMMD